MKKHLLSLLALCLMSVGSAFAQSEIVVGDMNDDGKLSISDVTLLTETLLGSKDQRVISTKCDPNVSYPADIAGWWSAKDKTKLILGADGSASLSSNSDVTSFEYYPFRGDLVLLNDEGYCVQDFHVLRQTSDYLLFVLADGSYVTYYSYENLSKQNGVTHEYVDLGLPSGTLWATCNIGASVPEEIGDYFAWGETQPKSCYSWSTLKYCIDPTPYKQKFSKYVCNVNEGIVDNKLELDLEDDAAYMNWGEGWRTPSKEQISELIDNCTWTRATLNGNLGFYAKSTTNERSIFIPDGGCFDNDHLLYITAKSEGNHMSRTIVNYGNGAVWILNLESHPFHPVFVSNNARALGYTVRPVRQK